MVCAVGHAHGEVGNRRRQRPALLDVRYCAVGGYLSPLTEKPSSMALPSVISMPALNPIQYEEAGM